jgi:hypothetical protein
MQLHPRIRHTVKIIIDKKTTKYIIEPEIHGGSYL